MTPTVEEARAALLEAIGYIEYPEAVDGAIDALIAAVRAEDYDVHLRSNDAESDE